jgi:hypothetical protein
MEALLALFLIAASYTIGFFIGLDTGKKAPKKRK